MKGLRTHYDNLKVARDAPDFIIRAAYRSLSQRYHPDKNPGDPRAAKIMEIINRSYAALSDPIRRKEHDEWIKRNEAKATSYSQETSSNSAPRASTSPPQDAHQPDARPHKAKTSKVLGADIVAGALIALIPLVWAINHWFVSSPSSKTHQASTPSATHTEYVPVVDHPGRVCRQISDTLSRCKEGGVTWEANSPNAPLNTQPSKTDPWTPISTTPQQSDQTLAGPYIRPILAPNGSPWPSSPSYVRGYAVLNNDGLSAITIDNKENNSDVFAKLVSLDGDIAQPTRHFFVPAFSTFTLKKVRKGSYDLRYMDLNTGARFKSESFDVQQTRTESGTQYSTLTMTLYKVQDGNFQTYPITESEF